MLSKDPEKKILVVDDNEEVLRSIKILLELAHLNVKTAADVDEAIEEIKNLTYDLLILDVGMPKIGGIELSQIIKKREAYRDIPVLFMSGFPIWIEADGERRKAFLKAEAYIQKPFDTKSFIETVQRLLKEPVSADRPLAR